MKTSTVDLSKPKKAATGGKNHIGNTMSTSKSSPYLLSKTTTTTGNKRSTSEKQGPIDWSHMGIKFKYRGEKQREDAYEIWKSSIGDAQTHLQDEHGVLPVIKIERHPIYKWFYARQAAENAVSNTRTKNRLLMKRFVLDVQEIWLTNLEHLREHQPGQLFLSETSISPSNNDNLHRGHNTPDEDYARGSGLTNRRDTKEIINLQHQVQSVSQKRVFSSAYHTTRLPPPAIKLDYRAGPVSTLPPPKPVPPVIQTLLTNLRFNLHSAESENSVGMLAKDGLICGIQTAVGLQIDRLLPSIDTVRVSAEVLWRFTVVRSEDLSKHVFVCTEGAVGLYCAAVITQQTADDASKAEEEVIVLYSSPLPVPLPYTSAGGDMTVEWEGQVTISLLPPTRSSLHDESVQEEPVRLLLTCNLRPYLADSVQESGQLPGQSQQEAQVLSVQISPAELRLLLQSDKLPLSNQDNYWLSPARAEDTFELLLLLLRLERDTSGMMLTLHDEIGQLRGVQQAEGMLTRLQAAACVSEILPLLRLFWHQKGSANSSADSSAKSDVPMLIIDAIFGNNTKPPKLKALSTPADSIHPYLPASIGELTHDWQADARSFLSTGRWERLLDQACNASLRAIMGPNLAILQHSVPGGSEIGKKGLAFLPDEVEPENEKTQVAARFFRDAIISSTDSILVNLALALETALISPKQLAWEGFAQLPPPTPAELVPQTIPIHANPARLDTLNSPIEDRLSTGVVIFTAVAVEGIDYLPRDTFPLPKGFKRYVPVKNIHGYREQVEARLLYIDSVLDSVVFGVTRHGALPNRPSVNARNIWHSVIAVNEHINRPRLAKDYHYLVANLFHRGANIPTSYTARMRAGEMIGVTSSAFATFEDNYAKIQQLRDVFARQVALESKIENVEKTLVEREGMHIRSIQRQLQRAIEKKLKKATNSDRGWQRRYLCSSLVELQGNWERRRDDRTGLFFFHSLPPDTSNPLVGVSKRCQWEVPAAWDGSMLALSKLTQANPHSSTSNNNTNGMLGPQSGSHFGSLTSAPLDQDNGSNSFLVQAAFADPGSSWRPTATATANGQQTMQRTQQHPQHGGIGTGSYLGSENGENEDLDSRAADRSLQESVAATIDTVNLEHLAEQLLSSDEVMRVLARRLGIPESQVVPTDDLSSVFSLRSNASSQPGGNTANNAYSAQQGGKLGEPLSALAAPRDKEVLDDTPEAEFDSDDELWSDDEHEVGDFDPNKELAVDEDLPQSQLEMANLLRREKKLTLAADSNHGKGRSNSVPSQIPYLDLTPILGGPSDATIEHDGPRFAWRRLPRPAMDEGFLTTALHTHVKGPEKGSTNTLNAPVFLLPISPLDACRYIPTPFQIPIESLFIPAAKRDMERSVATLERNIKREEEMARSMPTDDMLLFGEAREFTSAELFLAKQYKADQVAVTDPMEAAKERAILAAKASNIAQMEDCLAEEIPVNTADSFGNTLLILAAQQGSKRMCKFLLRRGGNINLQNLSGNTVLHYCYAYGSKGLAEYLKSKGADDSILNVDGLTCYEGLSRSDMNNLYGDADDAEEEDDQGEEAEGGMTMIRPEPSYDGSSSFYG